MEELDAVRAYREWTASVVLWPSGKHTTHHTDCGCFRALADAAIAALEAEVKALRLDWQKRQDEYEEQSADLTSRRYGVSMTLDEKRRELQHALDAGLALSEQLHDATLAKMESDAKLAAAERERDQMHVACPSCSSTAIKCNLCGYVSDGPEFLADRKQDR